MRRLRFDANPTMKVAGATKKAKPKREKSGLSQRDHMAATRAQKGPVTLPKLHWLDREKP